MTASKPLTILFLCTGNSARSILAEAIANKIGDGRLTAYSAGSFPKGQVHPHAVKLLVARGFQTDGFRSKSWNEFTGAGAPPIDIVITVCGNAAGETCPVWGGTPVQAHWGLPDPAAVEGTDMQIAQAFAETYAALEKPIAGLIASQPEGLDREKLKQTLASLAPTEGE